MKPSLTYFRRFAPAFILLLSAFQDAEAVLSIEKFAWCEGVKQEPKGGGEPLRQLQSGEPTRSLTFWIRLKRHERGYHHVTVPSPSVIYARWEYSKDGGKTWQNTPDKAIPLPLDRLTHGSTFRTWTTKNNLADFKLLRVSFKTPPDRNYHFTTQGKAYTYQLP